MPSHRKTSPQNIKKTNTKKNLSSKASSQINKTGLVWFRNDLRVHDHEPLFTAMRDCSHILCCYIFDPRHYQSQSKSWPQLGPRLNFPKTGAHRTQFLIEGIHDLRHSLQQLGNDLWIRTGFPEEEIPALVKQCQITDIFYHREVASEETWVENHLEKALTDSEDKNNTTQMHAFHGHTLFHPDDLPFDSIQDLPDVFTQFRKKAEAKTSVREMFPLKKHLPSLPSILSPEVQSSLRGDIPQVKDLISKSLLENSPEEKSIDKRSVLSFQGGEKPGLQRVQDYIFDQDCLQEYKETRNGMIGANYSSKFSAYLAQGFISPRYVYKEIQRYESERVANKSTYWLFFELLWRDYFWFVIMKYGNRIFHLGGIMGRDDLSWRHKRDVFDAWCRGETGIPYIDANMRELRLTGYMSNRGRQNAASFLVRDLGIDWRWGAAWFESCLLDHDVGSNYGNWNYSAGVGNDPRQDRYFNFDKQAHVYDPDGEYVRLWVPELASLPGGEIHNAYRNAATLPQYGIQLGKDYPHPLVSGPRRRPPKNGNGNGKKGNPPQQWKKNKWKVKRFS
eukprot:gb/GECH01003548.1/.p1 GENE.gb/GECH01003548.1/~~gb/GECH01003548.1/.p1  ORF type:complete len:562 (+),score=147.19 gb/GECH01003548.1/:1-1686(+)